MLKLLLCTLAATLAQPTDGEEARLLRFPHMQGDRIAFVHGGDIWTASAHGGVARRLTSFDEGYELFPRISPDGQWVAFSGEYTGTRQVFLVPYEGGEPRQLTFYPDVGPMPPRGGYDNLPLDWTPDGRKILVRMNRTPYGQRIGRYFLVDPWNGGLEAPLQIPEGGPASFSPDGTRIAYNIISREWRTWKRYRAGRAQDVWIYDLVEDTVERITEFEGTDNHPMWLGDRIYFTSDRTGTLNLYCFDLETRSTHAVTSFEDFDVLFPSRGDGGVIFERGGYLYVMDQDTEEVRRLSIRLGDDRPWRRPKWITGAGRVASYDVAPGARRVAVEVRGELFSVPRKHGEPENITRTPDRRERDVRWSPDGRHLSYLAEVGDDYELFLRDLRTGEEVQATRDTGAWIVDHAWSPDGKRIALRDRAQRLLVYDVASGATVERDRGREDMIGPVSWSGDSAWLAYDKQAENGHRSIWIAAASEGTPVRVTSDWFDDGSPTFDPGGAYLYFTSARDFDYGDLGFRRRIYAMMLRPDVESPIAYREDVEEIVTDQANGQDEDDGEDEPGSEASAKPESETADSADRSDEGGGPDADDVEGDGQRIVFDRIERRVVPLPLPPGGYFNLTGVEGGLLFVEGGALKRYDLESRTAATVLAGVFGYMLNSRMDRLAYRHGGGLALAGTSPGQSPGRDPVPVERIRLRIDPATEWRQIYGDAWRIMRDWFYDPGMHRVDWRAMREKYRPLVDHVAHRDDLDFVLGELIGELNVGHAYVMRGESPRVARVPVGTLGCELRADGDLYRISKIYRGEAWDQDGRAPLAEVGVDARVGDYLIEIDGIPLTTAENPYRLLENKVGVQVKLLLSDRPEREAAREVVVVPAASDLRLRYLDWVERNRRMVEELSDGRIGYIHVPNTAEEGHRRLLEGFRAQARIKEALIIDDRYNGGGHIPDRMIREIGMPVLSYWARRHAELDTTPAYAFEGKMAMLINGYSSSGGDAFPFYFRRMGLGPLIGKKTWGGLVGYSGTPSFVDGGGLAVPAFAFVNPDGEWDVEYYGVAPDHEVFDDPTRIQAGREPMIEFAVRLLLEQIERDPTPRRPGRPEGPDRSG